jgi:hypothetical protein
MIWTQKEAINLCRKIEKVCPKCDCHVALTGGLLYKDGNRKDLDILFYRVRQATKINTEELWDALEDIGIGISESKTGWCVKANYEGLPIDMFFPEELTGSQAYEAGEQVEVDVI